MAGFLAGAITGALLFGGGRGRHTVEKRIEYKSIDYDRLAKKTAGAIAEWCDKRKQEAIRSRIRELDEERKRRDRTCAYCGKMIVCEKFQSAATPFVDEPIKARFVFKCGCMSQEIEREWSIRDRTGELDDISNCLQNEERNRMLRKVLSVGRLGWKSGSEIHECYLLKDVFEKAYSLWFTLSAEDEHNGNDEIENERRALAAQLKSHELPQISGPHVAMQVKR